MRIEMVHGSLDDLLYDLEKIGIAGDEAVLRTQNFMARSTAARAQIKIRTGAKTGKYYIRKNPTRGHQASAPGEAPADDLGNLARSITFRLVTRKNDTAYAGTDLAYGGELERGFVTAEGNYVAPRPWLLPSFLEASEKAAEVLAREFRRLLK